MYFSQAAIAYSSYLQKATTNHAKSAYASDIGHHSIKVTVDIYGHLAPEGNKDAVDRLDDCVDAHYISGSLGGGSVKTVSSGGREADTSVTAEVAPITL